MENVDGKLELHVNDLVLMNVVGMSEDGPVFGVIDRVGAIDVEDVASASLTGNSQIEHAVTSDLGIPKNEDIHHDDLHKSLIAELEERREALDIAIQEMKRDTVKADALQSKVGISPPSDASPPSEISSFLARARRMRQSGEQASDHQ